MTTAAMQMGSMGSGQGASGAGIGTNTKLQSARAILCNHGGLS